MKRLGLAMIVGLLFYAAAMGAPFDRAPYTGAPDGTSITIAWSGDPQYAARIELLPDGYEGWELATTLDPRDPESTDPVHVQLTGLLPDTGYQARVVLEANDEIVVSPIVRFHTEPPSGSPVSFVVLGDTQWQWEGENRLAAVGAAIAGETDLDFILHVGDIVESPSSIYWDHWFDSFAGMLRIAPFIPVLGNHEKNHSSYYKTFALPPGAGTRDKRWWALHWGDVVAVGLDTNVRRADQIREQQAWAAEHLSGSETHKFVLFHHPVWSSDAYHGDGYAYDLIYHPIFAEHGVDIVFNGHAHNYERIVHDGVTYLVLGGGGAVPRPLAETRTDGSVIAIENYNFYARIDTSPGRIQVIVPTVAHAGEESFSLTNGRPLDTFSLPPQTLGLEETTTWIGITAIVGVAIAALLRTLIP